MCQPILHRPNCLLPSGAEGQKEGVGSAGYRVKSIQGHSMNTRALELVPSHIMGEGGGVGGGGVGWRMGMGMEVEGRRDLGAKL